MSKPFLIFLLALSVFILWLNLTAAQPNPLPIALWLLIGGISIYKLCKSPSSAS
jgi:hypothetical protein